MTDKSLYQSRDFITVFRWDNRGQKHEYAGTLSVGRRRDRAMVVGFIYDRGYIRSGGPALDPANLKTGVNGGMHLAPGLRGALPHYFSSLLPRSFYCQIMSSMEPRWYEMSDAEKLLKAVTLNSDYGAIHLNAHLAQPEPFANTLDDLDTIVSDIRRLQMTGGSLKPLRSHATTLSRMPGDMAKFAANLVDEDGVKRRYIVRVSGLDELDEPLVCQALHETAVEAGIKSTPTRALLTPKGHLVELSQDYTHGVDPGRTPGHLTRMLRYNRVSVQTLLANDPAVDLSSGPRFEHVIHAINRYSADAASDVIEYFKRSVMDLATCNTSNGLDNIEFYDVGRGEWRLAPSYRRLPALTSRASFQTELVRDNRQARRASIAGMPLEELIKTSCIDRGTGLDVAARVLRSCESLPERLADIGVDKDQMQVLDGSLKSDEISATLKYVADQAAGFKRRVTNAARKGIDKPGPRIG